MFVICDSLNIERNAAQQSTSNNNLKYSDVIEFKTSTFRTSTATSDRD